MLTATEIRATFLHFFNEKSHLIVPSAPVVVKNDPTLLFINAGMNPFKDAFLGNSQPPASRVADTQKCLRVSGKHNDLEEVGVDTYHHTLFEMLGNWSFGDYFKKDALAWSWELLTEVYGIPKEQLYVTVFGGDANEGLERDTEAFDIWKQYVPEDRILFGNKKDNFWEMGDTGPCGPCSEIHVDCRTPEERADGSGAALVNADHPQVIEIWNNVFMQFNRMKDGSLQPLPQRHVDTGMGLERLVRVLQQKQSNYDTDLFSGTIAATGKITGISYDGSDSREAIAFRVLADHIRAISFTIADGQLPSNTGAGYVIRRILRRAVRYYFSYLNYKQPLLHQLIPQLATQFKDVFPELAAQEAFVARVIREEEEAFLRTLEKGLKRLDELSGKAQDKIVGGREAFELFDTYGFPIDLTRLILSEQNLSVDEPAFEAALKEQKDRSRAATALETDDWQILNEGEKPQFTGYETLNGDTRIQRFRKVKAKGKEHYQLVLAQTPFYAESGGQVGDTGTLTLASGATIDIIDTKKENDLIVHLAASLPEDLGSGAVHADVTSNRRKAIAVHHSATHLMHAALRQVLGTHVAQKGSLVNDEYLRFDFSHFAKLTDEEIAAVEQLVNAKIRENIPVVIRTMPKEEALQLGAMALFGEKYGDSVRVVTTDPNYSVELCGGTHVGATGELGFFKIKSEGAVAAGVRRIEALSGAAAETYVQGQLADYNAAKALLKNPKQLDKSIESLQEEATALRKSLEAIENQALAAQSKELATGAEPIGAYGFIGKLVSVSSADSLRKLATDTEKALSGTGVVVLCGVINGKLSVAIAIGAEGVAQGMDAAALMKSVVAPLIKGGGGGNKTLATAGGANTDASEAVIEAVRKAVN
ncbi:MAG: alanine--tRNA ligase [Sphingobacteriales bacterium]|nr:MAG: alanine--tRNA ligase [Sphingobacteriales bacterium]